MEQAYFTSLFSYWVSGLYKVNDNWPTAFTIQIRADVVQGMSTPAVGNCLFVARIRVKVFITRIMAQHYSEQEARGITARIEES